ncbi:Alginate export [Sphingomonas laterariae]|uniref:Alginate export n=1 Tax=Edaphosphingomonas laterariae TaxID=861865 RepID=A0A239DGC6_9SPHN|nr:alginate export family protein [Sphingomonas laterariae]SNS31495.1 Alginate export [Sphingomonas laterariae]
MIGRAILAFIVALLLPRAAAAQVDQLNWRYDEDWTVLRDRQQRDHWWQAAKYQPLDGAGDAYVSAGLEARARYEGFDNNLWGGADAPDDGYLWLRLMPHVDVHAGPARGFVQLIAGFARGVAGGAGPADETGLDLLQGFGDLRLPIGDRGGLTLRGGRELVALGSERLVGLRYGPNIPQPFDGVRGILQSGDTRIDLIRLRPVAIGRGDFDDETSDVKRLTGVYATTSIAGVTGLDIYMLDYRNRAARFVQGVAPEHRRSIGLRLFGKRGDWAWNWEAVLQRGHFGNADIRAWTVATETAYRFVRAPLQPRFRLRANIASGDGDPADDVLGTFNPMFPKGKYFGELSPIGPYNIINLHPSLDADLGHGVAVELSAVAYWRARRGDGIYDIPGQLIRAPNGSRARFIGTQAEALIEWQANETLSFAGSLSIFRPGAFIAETGPAKTIRMAGLEVMYRF